MTFCPEMTRFRQNAEMTENGTGRQVAPSGSRSPGQNASARWGRIERIWLQDVHSSTLAIVGCTGIMEGASYHRGAWLPGGPVQSGLCADVEATSARHGVAVGISKRPGYVPRALRDAERRRREIVRL